MAYHSKIIQTAIFLSIAFVTPLLAQSAKVVKLPADKVACLVENKEKYLGVPRSVVFFTPELCPALSKKEVLNAARTVQNSGSTTTKRSFKRLVLNKKRLQCLYEKLEALEEVETAEEIEAEQPEAETKTLEVTLDCA